MVVLAALRAANTEREVIVATSREASDDLLVSVLEKYGIRVFRGSLENTLERFVHALEPYQDSATVFRLTGDNVVPDGALLDDIEQAFEHGGFEYLCTNGAESGLPYGMSVELTRLGHLRDAYRSDPSAYETEHVTPHIIKKFGKHCFEKYRETKMAHYRCTIDCLDDYLCVARLFEGVEDPVRVPASTLVERLKGAPLQPRVSKPAKRLVLGTAQLGGVYGIANTLGQPDVHASRELIKTAIVNGVEWLDAARAYGDSERVIGGVLSEGWRGRVRLVTKLAPFENCTDDAMPCALEALVDASVYQSMAELGVEQIDTLLLHRASHLHAWNGAAWRRVLEHQKAGRIQHLGVSVQSPNELLLALKHDEIEHIQLPFNLLDWRWDSHVGRIELEKKRRNLHVHARSVLLQGLLMSRSHELWGRAHVADPEPVWEWLDELRKRFHRESVADLCVGFVAGCDWIDGLVIGVESLEQLADNLHLIEHPPLAPEQIVELCASRLTLGERSLNPSQWSAS